MLFNPMTAPAAAAGRVRAVTLRAGIGAALLLATQLVQAAALGLTAREPDVTTGGLQMDYVWDGTEGVLTIQGRAGCDPATVSSLDGSCVTTGQTLKDKFNTSINPFTGQHNTATLMPAPSGGGTSPPTNNTQYFLQAIFDSNGVFDPTDNRNRLVISGFPREFNSSTFTWDLVANYGSGIVGQGAPFNFGFSGFDNQGVFEFEFGVFGDAGTACAPTFPDAPGDLFTACNNDWFSQGWTGGGVIIGTGVMTHTAFSGGDWDNPTVPGENIFKQSFSVSQVGSVDTFVPVPPAVWLFATGVALLGRAVRARQSST